MNNKDPYSILGVSRNASDDEVKNAYRALARKYHPDNFGDDPALRELANEKMQQINWAYDEIQRIKESGKTSYSGNGTYYQSANTGANGAGNQNNNQSNNFSHIYAPIREDINAHRFSDAERKLMAIALPERVAEWHYLMSLVLMSRKMTGDAMRELEIACNMDPSNFEYQKAKEMFNSNAGTYGNTYYGSTTDTYNRRAYDRRQDTSDACNCCANLLCLDCLCECMGGDLIACC